jgi:hypothetical protein
MASRWLILAVITLFFTPKKPKCQVHFAESTTFTDSNFFDGLRSTKLICEDGTPEIFVKVEISSYANGKELIAHTKPFKIKEGAFTIKDLAANNLIYKDIRKRFHIYLEKFEELPKGKFDVNLTVYGLDSFKKYDSAKLKFVKTEQPKIKIKKNSPESLMKYNKNTFTAAYEPPEKLDGISGLSFRCRIVPVFDWQTLQRAFKNNPIVIEKRASNHQIFLDKSNLKPNIRYAFQVQAISDENVIVKSSIKSFVMVKPRSFDNINNFNGINKKYNTEMLNTVKEGNNGVFDSSDFLFSGMIRTRGFYSSRSNNNNTYPYNSFTNEVSLTASIYGVPLKIGANTSNQLTNGGNQFGKFSEYDYSRLNFGVDLKESKEKIRRKLRQEVKHTEDAYKRKKSNLSFSESVESLNKLENNKERITQKYGKKYYKRAKKIRQIQALNKAKSVNGPKNMNNQTDTLIKSSKPFKDTSNLKVLDSTGKNFYSKKKKYYKIKKESFRKTKRLKKAWVLKQYLKQKQKYSERILDSIQRNFPDLKGIAPELKRVNSIKSKIASARDGYSSFSKADILDSVKPKTVKQSMLLNIQELEIGNFYAPRSRLTVSGNNYTGAKFRYASKYLLSVFYGRSGRKSLLGRNISPVARARGFNRDKEILSIKGGVGKRESNHIYVELLKGKERAKKGNNVIVKNSVFSVEGSLDFGERFKIKGKVSNSATYNEVQASPDFGGEQNVNPLNDLTFFGNSAYRVDGTYQSKAHNTDINLTFFKMGPRFYSSGVAFQRNDHEEVKLKLRQPFFENKIIFTPFVRRITNNIDNTKSGKTTSLFYGGSLKSSFNKYPNISINYSPFRRRVVFNNQRRDGYLSINKRLNANASYDYKFLTVPFRSTSRYTFQEIFRSRSGTRRKNEIYHLSNVFNSRQKFSVECGVSYHKMARQKDVSIISSSVRYGLGPKLKGSIGMEHWKRKGQKTKRGLDLQASIRFRLSDKFWGRIEGSSRRFNNLNDRSAYTKYSNDFYNLSFTFNKRFN